MTLTTEQMIVGFRWGAPNGSQVVLAITILPDEGVDLVDFGFLRTGARAPFGDGGSFGPALGHLQVVA